MDVRQATAVHWSGGEDDDWRELKLAPASNLGFREAATFLFRCPEGTALRIDDDEALMRSDSTPGVYEWQPGFFAGEVTAELCDGNGACLGLFLLDVAPDDTKCGRDVFAQMIDDLWAVDPSLVLGTEPATTLTGALGTLEDPWVAFARLRRYGPEFVKAMRAVRDRPRRTLRGLRATAALHHARRVDRQTVARLLRGSGLALFASDDVVAVLDSQAGNTRLDVPFVDESLDSAANRALRALAETLFRRASSLLPRLEARVAAAVESETRTALAPRWPSRRAFLLQLIASLSACLRRTPLAETSRAEVTAAGLNTVAADPIYSRAWGLGWRALRSGVEGDSNPERLWVSPSWEIYERWCFVRIGQSLEAALPHWRWRRSPTSRRWTGGHGTARAELRLQPTFRSTGGKVSGRWSVSRLRKPDIVLSVRAGNDTRFIAFDAKYRTSRSNVLDAMASAHLYRDSLRMGSRRPEASLLLVPSAGGAPWLEDEPFQEEHRVGVVPVSPGSPSRLPALAMALFSDLQNSGAT
jgi:hypothetical protein